MLDFDLAELYEVETRALKQAVRRNIDRFPDDFMFELSNNEFNTLKTNIESQNVIPRLTSMGYTPFAFTEQGVAMLSTVLKSKKAISVNIAIMRAFVLIRQYALTYKDLTTKLKEIEGKFTDVYEAINYLMQKDKILTEQSERKPVGYKIKNK